ncbi:TlyA family rRNA (cytidine-2'-O)-methyltransferase [Candidatus Saccharibacteria bacterium]|nr:MAG: TlyA family rRNA (cytidine-2'-O)-methyltransferase [Candidatus Saccharibacteria bacterium]PID98906.1 MAG: TlyA family rRNA (cytidine-2'-O)-methyltransferase [Candidatus Saccharibacteria bacterium]
MTFGASTRNGHAAAKQRLDCALACRKLVASRSQAGSYIRLGKVKVNGRVVKKAGLLVGDTDAITLVAEEQYVSRAALKLKSADEAFQIDWHEKTVLDVGSSTGGFTQYALRHGAAKVIAVEAGTDQMHSSLRGDERIVLHEKTDIRSFKTSQHIDIVVCDVSFVSLREILPAVARLTDCSALFVIMVKPQFEAGYGGQKHKGVIKNDRVRRDILKQFERWAQQRFQIIDKKDSSVAGSKGNVERFYVLRKFASG